MIDKMYVCANALTVTFLSIAISESYRDFETRVTIKKNNFMMRNGNCHLVK